MRLIEMIINLLLLSILVIVCSIPIVSVIPAVTAGFGVVRDWSRLKETAVIRPFLRHLRLRFLAGLALEIPYAVLVVGLWFDLRLVLQLHPVALRLPVFCVSIIVGLGLIAVAVALLTVLVHYDVGLVGGVRHAAVVVLAHPTTGSACALIALVTIVAGVIIPLSPVLTVGPSLLLIHRLWAAAFAKDDVATASEA